MQVRLDMVECRRTVIVQVCRVGPVRVCRQIGIGKRCRSQLSHAAGGVCHLAGQGARRAGRESRKTFDRDVKP